MPLRRGSSREVISSNIAELVRAGHSQSQAAAIAYKEAGEDCELTADEVAEIAHSIGAQDAIIIALDRSVRSKDADGRLHVSIANISRACVNPYYGREIPGSEGMGLKPDQIYQIFRDPEALRLGAETFNNLPLMDEHIIVSAENPEKDRVVGSTGTDAAFDGEFLTNSLVIWDAECIARIENGQQREISCAYRWTPINRPGTFKGQKYDLAMSALVGNHVALVPAGRAGPDVVVGDSLENASMPLSRTAIMLKGALAIAAKPILATDAKVDLDAVLAGVTAKNFSGQRSAILARFTTASKGKLAADASLEPIRMALDAMEGEEAEDEDESEEERKERESREAKDKKARDKAAKDKAAKDEETEEEEEESAEDAEEEDDDRDKARDASGYESMDAAGKKAWDSGWMKDRKARDARRAKDRRAKDKKAMDARIDAVRRDTIAEMNAIAAAKVEVEPFVGVITAAMDSAEAVYKFALDHAGVETKGVPPAAFKAMVGMLPDQNAPTPRIALDAMRTGADRVNRMFPQLRRIAQG